MMDAHSEIRSRAEARDRLIFLMENNMQKGRLTLLHQLYESEVHGLSLAGAARIITADLGHPIGIQTIRTLRKKSCDFKSGGRTGWEREVDYLPGKIPLIEKGYQMRTHGTSPLDLEDFKPLDVFSEEYSKKQSTIKWAKPTNI